MKAAAGERGKRSKVKLKQRVLRADFLRNYFTLIFFKPATAGDDLQEFTDGGMRITQKNNSDKMLLHVTFCFWRDHHGKRATVIIVNVAAASGTTETVTATKRSVRQRRAPIYWQRQTSIIERSTTETTLPPEAQRPWLQTISGRA